MREPDFWWRPGSGGMLSPLAAIYGAVAALRMQIARAAASAFR